MYNQLQQRHRLHFARERFGGHALRLLMPSDLEELLEGRDPFADVSRFPFWSRLWEAARVLAEVLVASAGPSPGRLLELGAGLGAPGLAAAAAGYQVVLSDYEQSIVDFSESVLLPTGLPMCAASCWTGLPRLRWSDSMSLPGRRSCSVRNLLNPCSGYAKNYLQPGGTVYLAHDVRRQCLPVFLRAAQERLSSAAGNSRS